MIVPTLPEPYQAELARAVALLPGDGPLPVVLASGDHAPLLENWIRHARAAGIQRFLVVAMDNSLAERVMCTGAVVARCRLRWFTRRLLAAALAGAGFFGQASH